MRKSPASSFSLMLLALSLAAAAAPAWAADAAKAKKPVAAAAAKPAVAAASAAAPVPAIPQLAVTTASGLTYAITHAANGRRPQAGETVFVQYTGMFTDGRKFDSSLDRSEPIGFTLGASQVIKGWDEGIARLGLGDHAVLVIPPQLAYGDKGAGKVIAPGTTLVFLVQLVDIRAKDKVLSNLLLDLTMEQGLDAAVKRYEELKAANFGDVYASLGNMQSLARQLMRKQKMPEAIAFLKLSTEAYPQSADALLGLADGLKRSGDKAGALAAAQRALAIDPKNKDALEMVGELKAD